ncbi:MAG: hypothetical protein H7222_16015 [Methylotenera sp.]|nr:hypothetical protein [Oligoflexia bacterium]
MKLFYAILLHLSAGLWATSFVLDVLFFSTLSPYSASEFALSSFWCITAGVIVSTISLGFGLSAYFRLHSAAVERHLLMSMAILLAYLFNLFSRLGVAHDIGSRLPTFVSPGQLILAALSVLGWIATVVLNRSVTLLPLNLEAPDVGTQNLQGLR